MKLKRLAVLLFFGILVAGVAGPAGKATMTIDGCDAEYNMNMQSCWLAPNPFHCQNSARSLHYSCMSSIPATPDFCSLAQQRANACGVYDPMTDFINYSECMTMSGIQFCQ